MTIFLHKGDLPANIEFKNSVAIDTETMGLNVVRDRLCLVQLSFGDGDAHLVQLEAQKYEAPNLKRLLENKNILKIFHFARFDLASLQYYLNVKIENIYCTKIASKLCRTYTDAHGLKALCSELLGVELSKKQQSSDWGNKIISEKQQEYAASDVLYLHQIKEILDGMIRRESRKDVFDAALHFLPFQVELDLKGFNQSMNLFSH